MIKRYRLVLNVPDPREGCWRPVEIGAFRTIESALRRSARVLAKHVHEVTRHRCSSDRWSYTCSLYDAKAPTRDGRGVMVRRAADDRRLEAPERIVPSVGELGWTP